MPPKAVQVSLVGFGPTQATPSSTSNPRMVAIGREVRFMSSSLRTTEGAVIAAPTKQRVRQLGAPADSVGTLATP